MVLFCIRTISLFYIHTKSVTKGSMDFQKAVLVEMISLILTDFYVGFKSWVWRDSHSIPKVLNDHMYLM